jgi:hypothetical protein
MLDCILLKTNKQTNKQRERERNRGNLLIRGKLSSLKTYDERGPPSMNHIALRQAYSM